jgi:1-phosphofructokinase family hexose kinase
LTTWTGTGRVRRLTTLSTSPGGEAGERSGLLVAGPNLTFDRTASLPELRPGEVLRYERVVVTPGGKGLNVARAARALGVPAALVGVLPGHTGQAAAALIAEEGVELVGVPTEGELRVSAIIREDSGRTTVLNEPGSTLSAADWEAYEAAIDAALSGRGVLVCSGSLPPGAPADAYARLVARARAAGVPGVVDTSGDALVAAIAGGVDLVTPNLGEAEAALGRRTGGEEVEAAEDARDRALDAAAALRAAGARAAVVTAAAAGAAVAEADGTVTWLTAPSPDEVVNGVGAGDVFCSALAAGIARGAPLVQAAAEGVGTATASVESPLAGDVDATRARTLTSLVERAP